MNHLRPTRAGLKRRPTAVRIVLPSEEDDCPLPHPHRGVSYGHDRPPLHDVNERTPLIKAGVTPDIRRTAEDVERSRTALMSAGGGNWEDGRAGIAAYHVGHRGLREGCD
jgi:hypothetical protein